MTGIWEAPGAGRSGALHKVVVSRQHLIVRRNGHHQDSPPDAYLPAARPYGIARMAWALWREVPDLGLGEALSFAMEARREGQTEVLVTCEWLAQHVEGRLLAAYRLVARTERLQ